MKTILAVTFAMLMIGAEQTLAESPPPQWFLEEIRLLTSGSGRWEADNTAYKDDEEPFDVYVTEWRSSFNGMTMTGRLFGVADGKESPTFWEFRHYWHPARQEVVIEQFGRGGVVGTGTMWREGATTVSDQEFSAPDGRQWRAGHRSDFPDGATHVTDSFDITDGQWKRRRSYTWKEFRPPENSDL